MMKFVIAVVLLAMAGLAYSDSVSGTPTLAAGLNGTGAGTNAWVSPTNALTSNGIFTNSSGSAVFTTAYLNVSGYGFAIPAGATINGIRVTVERKTNSTSVFDKGIFLMKNGVRITTNRSNSTLWGTGEANASYGNATDLWGTTWTPADINNASTGVLFTAIRSVGTEARSISVDWINMTVFYTPSGGDTCTYSGSGDWTIKYSDNCVITTDTDLGQNSIIMDASTGRGTLTIRVSIHNFKWFFPVINGGWIFIDRPNGGKLTREN